MCYYLRVLVLVVLNSFFLPSHVVALSPSSPTASIASARQLATNWFSIATHLQNPTLYSAEWANACDYNSEEERLVTSRNVQLGEILSLVPIHVVGLRGMGGQTAKTDWMVFDADQDQDYFQPNLVPTQLHHQQNQKSKGFGSASSTTGSKKSSPPPNKSLFRYDMPKLLQMPPHSLTQQRVPSLVQKALFCDVNPTRLLKPGWMGHLAMKRAPNNQAPLLDAKNCILVPIAMPLCALVATQDLPQGTCLILESSSSQSSTNTRIPLMKDMPEQLLPVAVAVFDKYRHEIQELQNYMNMADPKEEEQEDPEGSLPTDEASKIITNQATLMHPFYDFPRDYYHPNDNDNNVQVVLRTDPDILAIPNFLTDLECDRLIEKARPHLIPCVTKNPRTGAIEQDSSRTSRNANVPQSEVPSIVDKLTKLANCTKEQFEILQILHYGPNEYFTAHTDGFSGPVSACGFEASARLVTIFCYLNTVEQGGATRFGALDLNVAPKKGMAVIHFPTTLGFEEDARTEHEGMMAVDEKWLLVTWVWMHPRDQTSIYAEKKLDPLGGEMI